MNGQRLKGFMDNKGTTLVEIIVSVLIIGIVFVPLLMGLTNALKANARAESNSYAEAVAVNSLETVKTMGYDAIRTKFAGGASEVAADDFTANAGAKLKKISDNEYKVTGLDEGTNHYTATITFEDTFRDDDIDNVMQNEVTYNHFNEISQGRTCMIRSVQTEDDARLSAVMSMSGPNSYTHQITDLTEMKRLTTLKQTAFTIGKYGDVGDAAGENKGRYYVKKETRYKVKTQEGGVNFFDDAFTGLYPQDGNYESIELCPQDATGGPDTYLIFYSPLKASDKLNELNTGSNKEEIIIKKEVSGPINIYIFIAGGKVGFSDSETGASIPEKMNITLINTSPTAGNAGDVKLFCSAKTNVDYSLNDDDKILKDFDYSGKVTASFIPYYSTYANEVDPTTSKTIRKKVQQGIVDIEEGKQLYNVTVKIYDSDGSLKTTKSSTIIE